MGAINSCWKPTEQIFIPEAQTELIMFYFLLKNTWRGIGDVDLCSERLEGGPEADNYEYTGSYVLFL